MKFGYASVNTDKQVTDRQMDALRAYGIDEIFEENVSGTKKIRPQLNALLNQLRTGDTLVVYELKSLGRNTRQLLALVEDFQANGMEFVSLTEQIDTTTPMGRFVFTAWCALAQLDRDIISENTKSGLAVAKAQGVVCGRKPHNKKHVENAVKMYFSNEFSLKDITEATGISRQSIYEYVRKSKKERNVDNGKE